MSKKAKVKGRPAIKLRGKLRAKKITTAKRKPLTKPKAKTRTKSGSAGKKIIRIMGHGQFSVDARTLKKLSVVNNQIVELVSAERSDDIEFRKKLTELNDIVVKNGKRVDSHEIIKSDIILPSADLSIDEAKKLFRGEGVIPGA
ncbi:MAG TPA: hypothetical protein VNI77_04210 [Nitrososphaera sp.]|nr:hypothetical protein [Nitrososphaera sp.]